MKRLLLLLALLASPAFGQLDVTLIPECQQPLPIGCPFEDYTCSVNLQLKVCRQNIWFDFQTVSVADPAADYNWTGSHTWDGGVKHIIRKDGGTDGFYFDTQFINWSGIKPIRLYNSDGTNGLRFLALWVSNPGNSTQQSALSINGDGDLFPITLGGGVPLTWGLTSSTSPTACSNLAFGGKLTMTAGGAIVCQADEGGGGINPAADYTWTGFHSFDATIGGSNVRLRDAEGEYLELDVSDLTANAIWRMHDYGNAALQHAAAWVNNPETSYLQQSVTTINGNGQLLGKLTSDGSPLIWGTFANLNACANLENAGKLTLDAGGNILCQPDVGGTVNESADYTWTGSHSFLATSTTFRNTAGTSGMNMNLDLLTGNATLNMMAGSTGTSFMASFGENVDLLNTDNGVVAYDNTGDLIPYRIGGSELKWSVAPGCDQLTGGGKLTVDAGLNIVCGDDTGNIDPTQSYNWEATQNFQGAAFQALASSAVFTRSAAADVTTVNRFRFRFDATGSRTDLHTINLETAALEASQLDNHYLAMSNEPLSTLSGQCLEADSNGFVVGTGQACGTGNGGGFPPAAGAVKNETDSFDRIYCDQAGACYIDYDDDGTADVTFSSSGTNVSAKDDFSTLADAYDCDGATACTNNYSDGISLLTSTPAGGITLKTVGCQCRSLYTVAPTVTFANFSTNTGVTLDSPLTCATGTTPMAVVNVTADGNETINQWQMVEATMGAATSTTSGVKQCSIVIQYEEN